MAVTVASLGGQPASLGSVLFHHWPLIIDVAVVVIFGALNVGAWIHLANNTDFGLPAEAATRLREATVGLLTAVGFLLPLTVVAVQLRGQSLSTPMPHTALVDFFVATVWLAASAVFGLAGLGFNAMKGFTESILKIDYVGIIFGFQLIFLFVGVLRLVWAFSELVSAQLHVA